MSKVVWVVTKQVEDHDAVVLGTTDVLGHAIENVPGSPVVTARDDSRKVLELISTVPNVNRFGHTAFYIITRTVLNELKKEGDDE